MAESGKLILCQADYCRSDLAVASAAHIISLKINNAVALLHCYYRSRQRSGSDFARPILEAVNFLTNLSCAVNRATNRQSLFRIEASAARRYWSVIAPVCHQETNWHRVYPHAPDSLNILLNSGYTFLAHRCRKTLEEVGLLPQLGLLHRTSSGNPLVYDLMECFRHLAVDGIVVATFSRRGHSGVEKDSHLFKKVLALLTGQYSQKFRFLGKCEKLDRIIFLEALSLKKAMMTNTVWQPRPLAHGHHPKCRL